MDENPKPPKRRWLRFSIKAVLLAMLVIGAFLAGWKACEMEYREDAETWRRYDLPPAIKQALESRGYGE